MRRAARIDENQPEVVETFEKMGASVLHTHQLGQGAPDIVIGYKNKNVLIEIKDSKKPPSKRRLTPDEEKFHKLWKGDIRVVESADDAANIIREMQ